MSDNIQENNIEGILSSIKSILEEDEKNKQAENNVDVSSADDLLENVFNSEDQSDVLELSPDMRVYDNVDTLQNYDALSNEEVVVPVFEDSQDYELASNKIFEANKIADVEPIIPSNEPFFENVKDVDIDDLISDFSKNEQTENTLTFDEKVDEISLEDLLEDKDTPAEFEETPVDEIFVQDTPAEFEEAPVDEIFIQDTPAEFEEAPAIVEETAVFDPVIEIEPVVEETQVYERTPVLEEEQSQDVSSNIMSNFAKMFSHEEKSEDVEIRSVGDTSKTLEDLVVDAIQKAIGKEISAKWNNGSDFSSFVEAEIKHQVEVWMTNNMRGLIDSLIKKEFERVMAKVGS